jgi:hypothetical protein
VAFGAALMGVTPALASPARPLDLRVTGDNVWHASNDFTLEWTNPPASDPPLAAIHFRVRDPQGTTIREDLIAGHRDSIGGVMVPKVPGTYSAEVWLEDTAGAQGPASVAQLRFDDARPASIEPLPVPRWIGRTAFPLRIRLGHPPGPPPMSGFGGYAVAIDSSPARVPCAAADRCTSAEITLRGGAGSDELEVGGLPEGISYLHAVAVSGAGMKSPTSGHAVLRVDTTDPVTRLAGVPPDWTSAPVRLVASATDSGSGMTPGGEGPGPHTAIQVDGGVPTIASGASVSISLIEEGAHRIAYYARDAAGNTDDGSGANGIANRTPRTDRVRIDRTAPSLAFANAQDPADPDLLQVRIADGLSGPDLSRGWIGVRPAGSGDRFEPLPAIPPKSGELRARWDSDSFPAGKYEFRATGHDVAGNASATTRRRNGEGMVLSNPLKTTTALRAGFRQHGLERTVPYGRTVLLGGRLIRGTSTGLADEPVQMVERFAASPQPATRVSVVKTRANGSFAIRTSPGPSRTIAIAFDGSRTLAGSASQTLRLQVRSGVRLRASSALARIGGPPLVFQGRVLAPPGTIPAEGKSVQLQFRLPGLPWSEFRALQTDRRGRFRYAYRFSDDDSRGARFQFRAYVPTQKDWPYEPGGSRPVLVRGI